MTNGATVSRNCERFLERLDQVARQCGRNVAEIRLIAVAKTRPIEEVRQALACGLKDIGENKVQEAQRKYSDIERNFRLHMVGHLQSNKAKAAAKLFDIIQSVDSVKLAEILDLEFTELDKTGEIMLEVNCSGEPQKYGFAPQETLAAAERIFRMKRVTLTGLMTVAPFTDDDDRIRTSFQTLKTLFETIKAVHPESQKFTNLSMGMSDDYPIAVAEGSTMIRIGRALFGSREA
jgi:hypothetical protein